MALSSMQEGTNKEWLYPAGKKVQVKEWLYSVGKKAQNQE